METALYILHVLVCLAMLPIILLQSGKGGGVSAVFGGGGGGAVMGTRGASTFLTRMTTGAAIIFMCTSLALSYLSSRPGSVVEGTPAPVEASAGEAPLGTSQAMDPTTLPPVEPGEGATAPVEPPDGAQAPTESPGEGE